ncbi:MAG: 50S ribosomal protein L19e [Candidatus Micrarchaeota archaeon]
MELNQVKKMAAAVMKTGLSKVRIVRDEEAVQAMTKDDVRALIRKGAIKKINPNQPSKVRQRKVKAQKKKGRMRGKGKRKGTMKTRVEEKETWMQKIRSLRRKLNEIKPKLQDGAYRKLYMMCKGGYFRNKAHLMLYVNDKKLWKLNK